MSQTGFNDHALFLAFVEHLFLSLGETFSAGELILLVAILPYLIPRSGVDLQISFSIDEAGVKSGPCGHEELLLV